MQESARNIKVKKGDKTRMLRKQELSTYLQMGWEEVNESTLTEKMNKQSPIYKEYEDLKKKPAKDLKRIWASSHRLDMSGADVGSKADVIAMILRGRHGQKMIIDLYNLNEGLDEAYTVSSGFTKTAKEIQSLRNSLSKNSNLAKGIAKGLGNDLLKDFAKMEKHITEIENIWSFIEDDVYSPNNESVELGEAFYKAGSEKSKLDSGYRSHLKNDEGKTAYIGNVSYKKADTAKGEAEVYGDAYYRTAGKSGNERAADKAIIKYRQAHKKDIVEGRYLSPAEKRFRNQERNAGLEDEGMYGNSNSALNRAINPSRNIKYTIFVDGKRLKIGGKFVLFNTSQTAEKALVTIQSKPFNKGKTFEIKRGEYA